MRVLVIGGGIGGLTAARALLDAGIEALVLERRPLAGMLGGPGGIFIQRNAMRVFEKLAGGRIAERLMEEGGKVLDGGFFNVQGQALYINSPSFANEPDLGVAIRRPALQKILYEALPAGTVRTDAAYAHHHTEEGSVVAHLDSGEEVRGDVLVGADGLRSRVRARLSGKDRAAPPAFSGQTCWRGVFKSADVALDPQYTWMELWGVRSRFGYFDTGRGTCCFYAFANAPEGGADLAGALDALRRNFGHYGEPVPQILGALNESGIYRDDIFDRDPPGTAWGTGAVTLLGDAAHPTQPTLGQGGCMAIEDAFELARGLRRARAEGRSTAAALREYELSRTPRVGRVVNDSRAVARLAHTSSPAMAWARDWMYRLTPQRLGDKQFRWLFDYRPEW